MRLMDADALKQHAVWLTDDDGVARCAVTITDLAASPTVRCGECKHWNEARFDDWWCCEKPEMSPRRNFTSGKSA